MAVITGRYGAVEIALPAKTPDVADYTGVWGDGTEHSNTYSNNNPTKLPSAGLKGKSRDSEGNYAIGADGLFAEVHQLWIPQSGGNLVGSAPRIVSSITSWSLDNTISPIEYRASNTRGYSGKLAGLHDATGNIAGLGAIPPLVPGQRFRFYGFTGPSNGVVDNPKGTVYSITAIVNSVQIQVSYQWNSPITWTVGWQADWQQDGDELDVSYGNGFWDYTSIPCCQLLPSKKYKLAIYERGSNSKPISDLCLLDANIQFTNETAQYANSCSAKAGGWQSRLAGPTTCSVSTNIQGDDFTKTGDLYPGTNHLVRMYVGGDDAGCPVTCWEFNKLFFTGFSGLNVDTSNNSPLQFSCNMDYNAYDENCDPGYIGFNENILGADSSWDYLVNLTEKADPASETYDPELSI